MSRRAAPKANSTAAAGEGILMTRTAVPKANTAARSAEVTE
ncbi:hypothetical protein APY03_4485 [Variovorax sp. WDL1]|nr:hypothetical protein APY03_4485 [Variovorax sp. WDL1]